MKEMKYQDYEEPTGSMVSEPAATAVSSLTPTQQYLLRFFSRNSSEQQALEVKEAIFQYYQRKMDEDLDMLWEQGSLNQEKLNQYRNMHIRDILKQS